MKGALAPKRYELERNSFMALILGLRLRLSSPLRAGSTLVDRHELPPDGAAVELARPSDLVLRIGDHLLPLRDPADRARERKDAGEHRYRNAERALHDAGVEIDVGVELAAHEVIVLQRDFFQRHRQLEYAVIVQAELLQHLVAGFAHQLRPRIVVLVDTVSETHQLDPGVLVLRLLDEISDLGDIADLLEHLQGGLVRAAVRGPPQAG